MIEVLVPYRNTKVWKPRPTGTDLILARIRQRSGDPDHPLKPKLQPDFEDWAVEHMRYDWGLEELEGGMVFQFPDHRTATLFKLTWC